MNLLFESKFDFRRKKLADSLSLLYWSLQSIGEASWTQAEWTLMKPWGQKRWDHLLRLLLDETKGKEQICNTFCQES